MLFAKVAIKTRTIKRFKEAALRSGFFAYRGVRSNSNLGQRMLTARLSTEQSSFAQDLKIEINRLTRQEAMSLAHYLASIVGRAHGRQMDSSQRRLWLSDLARNHKASLEAPSWLWASVVELIALHETAYLDHCRQHALSEAA